MSSPVAVTEMAAVAVQPPEKSLTVVPLREEDAVEVLAFLAERPLHTVVMAGFIRDNGVVSPLNRGTFYACRDAAGRLEGVAIIGHATLVETRCEAALEAFARLAQNCLRAHVIMGERERVERFWGYYTAGRHAGPSRVCRELLFEQQRPPAPHEEVAELRHAALDDLPLVMPVQAQMSFEECGVDPSLRDPDGFRQRCARRIEQKRVWVWVRRGRLIFKADVISETPEVIYLEGIYVNPEERGRGYGSRCLSQLSRHLLARTRSISLLVNERKAGAVAFYRRAGYQFRCHYDTIYLQQTDAG